MLTLKPQGWEFDMGIKASTRGFKPGFESGEGGKEEAGDEGKGGEIFTFACVPSKLNKEIFSCESIGHQSRRKE